MGKIVLVVLIPFSLFSISWEQLLQQDVRKLDIRILYYDSLTEIRIINQKVHIKEKKYEYENPYSANPSRVYYKEYSRNLTFPQLEELLKIFYVNRFWQLEKEYGSPSNQRFYPYVIRIQLKEKKSEKIYQKEVIFRSNPMYPGPSKEFLQVQKAILSFVQ